MYILFSLYKHLLGCLLFTVIYFFLAQSWLLELVTRASTQGPCAWKGTTLQLNALQWHLKILNFLFMFCEKSPTWQWGMRLGTSAHALTIFPEFFASAFRSLVAPSSFSVLRSPSDHCYSLHLEGVRCTTQAFHGGNSHISAGSAMVHWEQHSAGPHLGPL